MIQNREKFVSALTNVQVTNTTDSVWFLDHIMADYENSPLGMGTQSKMLVGTEDAAFLLQAFIVATHNTLDLNGYDSGIGYYLWDYAANTWDKVDFPTYAMH